MKVGPEVGAWGWLCDVMGWSISVILGRKLALFRILFTVCSILFNTVEVLDAVLTPLMPPKLHTRLHCWSRHHPFRRARRPPCGDFHIRWAACKARRA